MVKRSEPESDEYDPDTDYGPDAGYDPEAEFEDPESDSITIPDVTPEEQEVSTTAPPEISIPEITVDETDVPEAILQHFWLIVIVLNAALLALSLGSMMILFRGMLSTGGALAVGGVVLFGLAFRRYRTLQSLKIDDSPPTSDP